MDEQSISVPVRNKIDKTILDTQNLFLIKDIKWLSINCLNMGNRRMRKLNAKNFNKLIASIKYFGIVRPILTDANYKVIDGHALVEAAMELGIDTVPVAIMDHLDPADTLSLGIALNALQENGIWIEDALAERVQLIHEAKPEFDLTLTGIEYPKLELLLENNLEATKEGTSDQADNVPMFAGDDTYKPTARKGDLFLLQGEKHEHRIFCGDARSKKAVAFALGTYVAILVLTDPPFNVPIQGHVSGLGKTKHREFPMASGEMSSIQFYQFLLKALKRMAKAAKDGALIYLYMDKNGLELLLKAGRKAGLKMISICIWRKSNAGMSSLYRSHHEFIVIFKKGKAPHVNNIELGRHGRYRTTVWDYPGFNSFSKDRQELFKLHPTLKPVQMLADVMRDVTRMGDVVFDPFSGAGSTMIAAEKTNRLAVSIELDPIYVDTAIKRFETQFGAEAVHTDTGMTFSELTKARSSAADAQSSPQDIGIATKPDKPIGRIRTRNSSKKSKSQSTTSKDK